MLLPESVLQDLRYGARTLSGNVGFTSVAILALSLGIGVNTAVFTAYKAMVARPIEAGDPKQMVNLALIRQSGAADFHFSYPDYKAYRDSLHSFSAVAAFRDEWMTLSGAGGVISQRMSEAGSVLGRLGLFSSGIANAEFADVYVVSENYFSVLGVKLLRGRGFKSMPSAEFAPSPSVLISENYWQRRFAKDPAVLGKTIRLNRAAVQIIGITPHDFIGTGIAVPDFWVPLSLEPLLHADENWLQDRENQCCRLMARLAPGITASQAEAEMTLVANHLRALHDPHSESAKPVTALVWPASPFPLPLKFFHGLTLAILLIMVAAAMLLVVACANVGSLQLARARSRQHELHTRLSLGASRRRLIRQLLTESALLGLIAGMVALLFAWAFLQVSVYVYSKSMPSEYGTLIFNVTPDLEIFTYVLGISLFAGILFGLAPALESSASALSAGTRGSTSSIGARRLQNVLVATQVALSLVLIIAGSILIRSSIYTLKMETGYDAKHVISLDFQFPEGAKYTTERKLAVARALRARLAALPGVVAITSARAPDDNRVFRTAALPLNQAQAPAQNGQSILYYTYVQSNYFATLGIPRILGQGFESHGQAQKSVVLSESAARELWPGQNPIGRSLRLGLTDERAHNTNELIADGPAYQIVGVARDTRGSQFDGSDSRQIYLPLPDDQIQSYPILIRTQIDPAQVIRAMEPVISSIDPDLLATSSTLEDMLRSTAPFLASTMAAGIASGVGLIGLVLALMGIYGTVSYIVVLRTREVGIRMAVGAQKSDILALILRESTRPVIAGLLIGMVGAVGASFALRGILYGVGTVDGVSFIGASLTFLAIALFAAYPPSRRAMRVDPAVALRYE